MANPQSSDEESIPSYINITLVCFNEKDSVTIKGDAGNYIGLVRETYEGGEDTVEFPIMHPDATKENVAHVAEFCKHMVKESMPPIPFDCKDSGFECVVPKWFVDFVDMKVEKLIGLLQLANYLNVEPLINVISAKIGSIISKTEYKDLSDTLGTGMKLTQGEFDRVVAISKEI